MQQQINFYRDDYRSVTENFAPGSILIVCGVIVLAMFLGYGFVMYKLTGIERELQTVNNQEKAAIVRLESLQPSLNTASGDPAIVTDTG